MPGYITSDAPMTYVLDYGGHMHRIDDAVKQLQECAPQLLHIHCDMPYVSRSGPSEFIDLEMPFPWMLPVGSERTREATQEVRDWVARAHEAGVEIIVPYICNQTMGGEPDKRTGMWWLYDRWEEYEEHLWFFAEKLLKGLVAFPPGHTSARSIANVNKALTQFLSTVKTRQEIEAGFYAVVGSPQTVRDRLAEIIKTLGVGNLLGLFQLGTLPADLTRKSMTLFANEVLPSLRNEL